MKSFEYILALFENDLEIPQQTATRSSPRLKKPVSIEVTFALYQKQVLFASMLKKKRVST